MEEELSGLSGGNVEADNSLESAFRLLYHYLASLPKQS